MTGVFLTLLGLYTLTAPGRIDMIDGQWRYDVARNWLDRGEPVVTDQYLLGTGGATVDRRTGTHYAVYNAAPSITPMPFMLVSRCLPGHTPERDQFAFSLTGPVFGALLGVLLMAAFRMLGLGLRQSVSGTALFCLTTLWWPASVTIFDQNQHAVLLLASLLLAWQAGRRCSLPLAGLGGLVGGMLFNYQEMYGLVLPIIGLAVIAAPADDAAGSLPAGQPSPRRAGLGRYLLFGLGCCVGLGLLLAYNEWRFGMPVLLDRYGSQTASQPRMWGDPVAGLIGLAVSPGKGILWYSPPLAMALLGARRLFARAPVLTVSIAAASAVHLLVIGNLTFFGGDWCWGPRYAIPAMALWALLLPFGLERLGPARPALHPLVLLGLLVQLLGVSLDHHRFFYERNYAPMFWAADPWIYFKQSQLIARPVELCHPSGVGPVPQVVRFNPSPSGQSTYCPFGPPDPAQSRQWMRHFRVFYLPRPWWGWIGQVQPADRPMSPSALFLVCGLLLVPGTLLLTRTLRAADDWCQVPAHSPPLTAQSSV
jgi:hypothetical protein